MCALTIGRLEDLLQKRLLFQECGYCIRGINSTKSAIYLCLSCGEIYCSRHFPLHAAKYPHPIAAEISQKSKFEDQDSHVKRAKSADFFSVAPVTLSPGSSQFEPYHGTEINNSLLQRIEEIFQLHDLNLLVFPDEEQKAPICPHISAVNPWSVSNVHKCNACDLTHNLWLCLSCSTLSCGRRQFDGTGGNGHSLAHYDGEGHPIAIRLGTMASKSPEVYCYVCDSMTSIDERTSSYLHEFLSSEAASQLNREQSLLELERSKPSAMDESTLSKHELLDNTYMGIRNLGNTCYISVILQMLFFNASTAIGDFHFQNCYKNPNSCLECQLIKISIALSRRESYAFCDGLFPVCFRRLLITELPSLASSSAQQDAAEFFQAFLCKISRLDSFREAINSSFPVSIMNAIECACCGSRKVTPSFSDQFSPIVVVPKGSVTSALSSYFGSERVSNCDQCCTAKYAHNFICASSAVPKFILIQLYVFEFSDGKIVKVPINLSSFSIDSEFPASVVKMEKAQGNAENLDELTALGFSRPHIEKAIKNADNPSDINALVDWLCSNPEDDGESALPNHDASDQGEMVSLSNQKYRLSAIIAHCGKSTNCGHYFLYIKNEDAQWLMFDDEKVYKISEAKVDFASSYLLLYSL